MSVGAPKISCFDVNKRLNGTYATGSDTYTFVGQTISSGSLWDICSGSSIDNRFILGDSVIDSTDANTVREIKELELATVCFRTLVQLSGGIVTSGFSWDAGISVSNPHIVESYRILISEFGNIAGNILKRCQTFVLSAESDVPSYNQTANSLM